MTPLYTCNRELSAATELPEVFRTVSKDLSEYGALIGSSHGGKKALYGVTYTFTSDDTKGLESYLQHLANNAKNSLWTGSTRAGTWDLGSAVDAFKKAPDLPPAYLQLSFDRPVYYFVWPGIEINELIPTVYSWAKAAPDVDLHVLFTEIFGYYSDPTST